MFKKKIGVDPDIGGTLVNFRSIFEQNNEKFDLIFLDGLHTTNKQKKIY